MNWLDARMEARTEEPGICRWSDDVPATHIPCCAEHNENLCGTCYLRDHPPFIRREQIAELLRDTVQTLDKDEEWHIADMLIARLAAATSNGSPAAVGSSPARSNDRCGVLPWGDNPASACVLDPGHEPFHKDRCGNVFVSRETIAEAKAMEGNNE